MKSVLVINYPLSFIDEEVEGHEGCHLSTNTKVVVAEPDFAGRSLRFCARIFYNTSIDPDMQ